MSEHPSEPDWIAELRAHRNTARNCIVQFNQQFDKLMGQYTLEQGGEVTNLLHAFDSINASMPKEQVRAYKDSRTLFLATDVLIRAWESGMGKGGKAEANKRVDDIKKACLRVRRGEHKLERLDREMPREYGPLFGRTATALARIDPLFNAMEIGLTRPQNRSPVTHWSRRDMGKNALTLFGGGMAAGALAFYPLGRIAAERISKENPAYKPEDLEQLPAFTAAAGAVVGAAAVIVADQHFKLMNAPITVDDFSQMVNNIALIEEGRLRPSIGK